MRNWKLIIGSCLVIASCILVIAPAGAMGGGPPEKPEAGSEYNLEIIKMDYVGKTMEATTLVVPEGSTEAAPKYKLEILKMDVITTPAPPKETSK